MKSFIAASAFALSVLAIVPAAQASGTCDDAFLLSVSHIRMPTKNGWTHEREARFMRNADNVVLQLRLRPQQLTDEDVRRARYDHNPQFKLCSISGQVDILPVLK